MNRHTAESQKNFGGEEKLHKSPYRDSGVGERMNRSPLSSLPNRSRPDRQQALILGFLVGATPALMALVPWDFGTEFTNYRALIRGNSLVIPAVEVMCIFWALRLNAELFEPIRNFPLFEKIALTCLAGIAVYTSIFVAIDIPNALIGLLMWLAHLLFGIALFQIAHQMKNSDFDYIFISISIGILVYLSILIIYITTIESPDQYYWAVLIPGITHIRSLGFFSIAGFAAGAAISFRSTGRFHFPLGLLFASTAFGLAIWSATRGALFAILATIFFLLVHRSEYRNIRFVSWVTGVAVIGILLSSISYKPNDQFGLNRLFASIENSNSLDRLSTGRVQIWRDTVTEIAKRPLFGFGERQFRTIGPERARGLYQPHNIFLQVAFQWGMTGALLFFLLLARLGTLVWRRTNRGRNLGMGEQMLIISTLVYSLYDAALFYPYPILMFTLVVALALTSTDQPAPAADRSD